MHRWWTTGVSVALIVCTNRVAAEPPRECSRHVTPTEARSVFERLRELGLRSDCRLDDFQVERFRLNTLWKAKNGVRVKLGMVPRACAPQGAPALGEFAISEGKAFEAACPVTRGGLQAVLDQRPQRPVLDHRRLGPIALVLAAIGLALASAWTLHLARRRRGANPWSWVGVGMTGFVLALAARFSVAPTLANWYSEVASRTGYARFGPVAFSFQRAAAALFPWSDTRLFQIDAILGSLMVPAFVVVLRQVGVRLPAALGTTLLFALAPLHIRVSASSSEHVLSAALTLWVLALWTSGVRLRQPVLKVAALMLLPAAALTRVDAIPQLAIIPLWGFLVTPNEERKRWRDPCLYCATLAVVGLIAWFWVVIPSKHPMPEWLDMKRAALSSVTQFWAAATRPPRWWSLSALVLAMLGIPHALLRARKCTGAVVVTLAVSFGALGRDLTTDGLVGARYFLALIPVALVPSGFGFQALHGLASRALRPFAKTSSAARDTALLVGLGALLSLLAWWGGSEAQAYRYAFQDEYRFLRERVAELPAGCTVLQLPLRHNGFERDMDCCLDAPRSPLVIARGDVHFAYLETPSLPATESSCVYYYEGAACSLADSAITRKHSPVAQRWFREQCQRVRLSLPLAPPDLGTISPNSTTGILGEAPVVVKLYRVDHRRQRAPR